MFEQNDKGGRMIFYFSGTGNSRWVAEELARQLNDKAVFIPEARSEYQPAADEKIGFVFPVYAWSAPKCVFDFIRRVRFEKYDGNFVYFVCTCHTQTGRIDRIMQKALKERGMRCDAGFSLKMPNNYLLAPFVRADREKKKRQLIARAQVRLGLIADSLKKDEKTFRLTRGFGASVLSGIGRPLFEKLMTVKGFYATDACNQCGLCAKVCPVGNISVSQKPVWGDHCEMCQACLNYCPCQAIQYGHYTKNKKRYVFSKSLLSGD